MDRREFLGLLGLASGASLLAGCDLTRKSEKLIPYLVPPDDGILPGEATYVATSCTECTSSCGMTARIRESRPVKVDGTPAHPLNDGALCMRGQASLARLYHVDRIRQPLVKDAGGNLVAATWPDALKRAGEALRAQGERVLLSGRTTGSLSALIDDFSGRTGVRREPEFELFSHAAVREANRSLFGAPVLPLLHPDRADLIITVGADVVETFGNPTQFTVALSKRRGSHNRLTWYHAEPHASMTGFQADHRLAVKPGSEAYLLAFLLHSLSGKAGLDGRVASHISSVPAVSAEQAAISTGLTAQQLEELRHALLVAEAPLVVAGGVSTAQETGLDTARLAALIQAACNMHGRTVDIAQGQDYSRVGSMNDVERLMNRLDAGTVKTLVLFNIDPVSQMPVGKKFSDSIDKATFVIGVSDLLTPTMEHCDVVLPLSHTLESWGDAEPANGIVNVIQPTMPPLFDTRSNGDVLLGLMIEMGLAAAGTTYQQYVADRWSRELGADGAATMLKQGWVARPAQSSGGGMAGADHKFTFAETKAASGAMLVVAPSARFYDGRSADLPLLHEIPDPLTSITWDNWVSVGKETADALGVGEEAEIELRGEGWSVPLVARLQPGLAKDVFVIQRGAANPAVGWSRLSGEANAVVAITASATGRKDRLAKTSGSLYEEGRGIVPGNKPEHFNNAGAVHGGGHHDAKHEDVSFYPLPKYPKYRWAMAVDMDKCTGCSACVAACYVENNIPMTGRDQHLRGREMAWIRLEQYYEKDGSSASFVPAMCQQCDYAPCEPVCPVYATYHNDEGLNAQVYNRCVGTRYCGNNCPYKQRRFNFFAYDKRPHPLNLMVNPDVSVRGKGVMEKCTFCVQRIRTARDLAKDEKRDIREGEVTTACAQACPGKAIVFGNLLDENSEVHKWAHDARSSRMLEELGTSPGVFYLASAKKEMATMEHKAVATSAAAHPSAMARLAIEREVISAMQKPGLFYWGLVGMFATGFGVLLLGAWALQIWKGVGLGGQNNPVGWGIYIVNFVFWVGIAHSGTLISAVLFLFRSKYRASFNRAAEAMTVIAVMCAGMYPLIHLGRAWYFFWLLPYPNQRLLWTNFKSPLEWDVFAISTYLTISVVFFYVGLIPDFAIVKRYTRGFSRHVYSALSLGWVGTKRQWRNYNMLYALLAGLAAPLVLSVHSVVSWDFAMGLVPGWHTTIFAPYFVAGAIFSGCGMVLTLCIPMRKLQKLDNVMPIDHFEKLAKTMLFTSMIVGYAYTIEFILAYYSGNVYEYGIFKDRATGYYKYQYWGMVFCNMIVPLPLFVKKLRRNLKWLFITSIFVNIGMWLERFVIIITSLAHEFTPYAWGVYKPRPVEISIMCGTFCFFFMMFLLFAKFLPVVAITEKKEEVH